MMFVAQFIAQSVSLMCLLSFGPHPHCLPCPRLPRRPHISMDTFSGHSAYCEVSMMWFRAALSTVKKVLKKISPRPPQVSLAGPRSNCGTEPSVYVAQISHTFAAQPTAHPPRL